MTGKLIVDHDEWRSLSHFTRLMTGFAILAGTALVLAGVSSATGSSSEQSVAATITVTIRDTSFGLSKTSAPVGTVTFAVKNAGKVSHTFGIDAKKTPVLKPGKTAKLVVVSRRRGATRTPRLWPDRQRRD